MVSTKWVLAEPDAGATEVLSREAGLHPIIARLMVIRGIMDPEAARSFFSCELSGLSDPAVFDQMDKAVTRARSAIEKREKITVYGDYDVDGVTGTSLLYLALKDLGANVHWYIPDRMSEGYGLNKHALEKIKADGTDLVISVDCGITAFDEAGHANGLGLDLIITDHHELAQRGPGAELPRAVAVLHPLVLSPGVPAATQERISGLTGVGIAFKYAQALAGATADDERMVRHLDLVTLGTIADVGRITGENRTLVKHGLEALSSKAGTQRVGVAALKEVAGLNGRKIGVGTVGFTLAPRINAGGRLERADLAFRMLTTDSPAEARELASSLDAVNRERQSVEAAIWEEARRRCLKSDLAAIGALVLSSDRWHPGVIGIVSSRLVEEFHRPTALISVQNGMGKGSARSIPGFDLYDGLCKCSDLLLGFGGHKYAAGFSVKEENIPLFRERLSTVVLDHIGPRGFVKTVSIDGAVSFDELTLELMQKIEKLAPFGQGNPEPRLGSRGLEVVSSRIVGNNHLKLRFKQKNGVVLDAIAFNRGKLLGDQVRDGARMAAVFTPRLNTWNGKTSVELDIKDMKSER